MSQNDSGRREIKSYVLRAARMSRLQRRSYEELLPRYSIPFSARQIDPAGIFPDYESLIVEIGFGMGESTVALAQRHPGNGYLGIEVHKPGVGKVLSEIERLGLDNLRIINHDAVEVFEEMIPPVSVDGIHIFFPDPWPKKKHHKRRLIQPAFLELLRPSLKPGGYLYICTDWEEYAEQILEVCSAAPGYRNCYASYADPQAWRPRTKFEQKGLAREHRIRELLFRTTT